MAAQSSRQIDPVPVSVLNERYFPTAKKHPFRDFFKLLQPAL